MEFQSWNFNNNLYAVNKLIEQYFNSNILQNCSNNSLSKQILFRINDICNTYFNNNLMQPSSHVIQNSSILNQSYCFNSPEYNNQNQKHNRYYSYDHHNNKNTYNTNFNETNRQFSHSNTNPTNNKYKSNHNKNKYIKHHIINNKNKEVQNYNKQKKYYLIKKHHTSNIYRSNNNSNKYFNNFIQYHNTNNTHHHSYIHHKFNSYTNNKHKDIYNKNMNNITNYQTRNYTDFSKQIILGTPYDYNWTSLNYDIIHLINTKYTKCFGQTILIEAINEDAKNNIINKLNGKNFIATPRKTNLENHAFSIIGIPNNKKKDIETLFYKYLLENNINPCQMYWSFDRNNEYWKFNLAFPIQWYSKEYISKYVSELANGFEFTFSHESTLDRWLNNMYVTTNNSNDIDLLKDSINQFYNNTFNFNVENLNGIYGQYYRINFQVHNNQLKTKMLNYGIPFKNVFKRIFPSARTNFSLKTKLSPVKNNTYNNLYNNFNNNNAQTNYNNVLEGKINNIFSRIERIEEKNNNQDHKINVLEDNHAMLSDLQKQMYNISNALVKSGLLENNRNYTNEQTSNNSFSSNKRKSQRIINGYNSNKNNNDEDEMRND